MSTLPHSPHSASDAAITIPTSAPGSLDSAIESASIERSLASRWQSSRWIGWRLRLLVAAALAGSVALFLAARTLALLPHVDANWRLDGMGQIELASAADPVLRSARGAALVSLGAPGAAPIDADALLLQRSPRWITDDAQRERHLALHRRLGDAMAQGVVRLRFVTGRSIDAVAQPRGFIGLGAMFWLLGAFALGLYLVAMVALLARPSAAYAVYAVMALCQAGNLACTAIESAFELGLPAAFAQWSLPLRTGLDLLTAAAIVHAATVHPLALPHARLIAGAAWGIAVASFAFVALPGVSGAWWWTQAVVALLGCSAIALMSWSFRIEPHPFAVVMRRFATVTVGGWIVLTLALAATTSQPGLQQHIASIGPVIWVVFFASLLLVLPFLSRSQQVLREFSMVAAASTVATSLDLLFLSVFSLSQFASLTLALFLGLGAYIGARQWIVNQMLGSGMQSAERTFEQLYRIARAVEADPTQLPAQLMRLLRELFEPLEIFPLERSVSVSRVISDGSTLVIPVPRLGGPAADAPRTIALRFAQRGRRLFTRDDARLTDRIVDQLQRAVAHDRAVEQGRSEERTRLAQDLHDDIGARLLTLMYKAQSPEMEDYVRHTLLDLKTLTRGLAAASHPLSHAVAEWKADLVQRLAAAQCELGWNASFDRDVVLSVVQWSALTRVLRELVSNAIAHAQATRVDIVLRLDRDHLELTVADNGCGHNPHAWAHGLGLGGVRKRVKQLGGEVEWRENLERGISCHVRVRELSRRP